MGPLNSINRKLRQVLDVPETVPALRRFFVTTTFDAAFVMLGIIMGSAFSSEPNYRILVVTIITTSIAAGISTGVSIFEAESLEQTIRLREIEKALLVSLEDTEIRNIARWSAFVIAAVNFCSPIITGFVLLAPFLIFPQDIRTAAWISAGLTIAILFITGAVMARSGERNPLVQAARMAIVGIFAFALLFWIESLI